MMLTFFKFKFVGRCGALVDSTPFVRRVADLITALGAT